jgi:hypothetical protein
MDFRGQVRTDIRAFMFGAVLAFATLILAVFWALGIISDAAGGVGVTICGGVAVVLGVTVYLLGPHIRERAFVVAPAGLAVLPLALSLGGNLSPLAALAVSMAIAMVSTAAFFAFRSTRKR